METVDSCAIPKAKKVAGLFLLGSYHRADGSPSPIGERVRDFANINGYRAYHERLSNWQNTASVQEQLVCSNSWRKN